MEESTTKRTLTVLVIIMLCCLLLAGLGVGGYVFYTLTGSLSPAGNDPTQELVRVPAAGVPVDTLDALKQTIVPENDPRELACRLKGVCNVPETLDPPTGPRSVGDKDNFWILNSSTNEHANVAATLQYATDRSYFFVQDGVSFDMDEARQLVDTFDNEIYPKNREFFGEEWTPGIDGDPHIYILYARDLGGSVAGFFSSADETQPAIHEFSNGHEMFVFSADSVNLSSEFAYGVLAHEFQHMIHWHGDRN